jgi:nucleotide-binding universal stress UspA family protein
MITPQQIVIATDFSPASNAALSVARRIARTFNAGVTLVHVFQFVPRHQYRIPVEWMVERIRKEFRNKLEEAGNWLRQSGIETDVIMIEDGFPALEILSYLGSREAPLLVIGTHAFGGLERFLLGSTAEEVLRKAECPVITVGPHVLTTSEDQAGLRKILFTTDFSESSLAAVPFLLALQQASGAQIRVLHVSAVSASEEDSQFDGVRAAFQGAQVAEYKTLHGDNIAQAVVNEAERYPADLLVLGVQHAPEAAAHLAPKTAFQIISAAPCAVLTIAS